MTAVAVTLLSTHPNKQEKKIILKESRYAKRESVISFRSRFKINSNISRAKFFKIYYRFENIPNSDSKIFGKAKERNNLEGNEVKAHRTDQRLSGVMGNATIEGIDLPNALTS